ncbi:hypothetical protein [Mycoplasma putrefaciens]|uniref:Uncharacterized protein n=1 Tax=Mycoplasma putrefaciens (strain ATCC 15718 / NCTC 10155 / C30 KS-1 / KS-1) TaxID=743965 RepID=A0A7U4E9X9_MYCPK|nr:hypothetical protein [Mycoplasma putrefaciens]AEM68999.1 uncharacterized protein MPUT_0662 [Mycoplasma putrefaciens KS1]SYV96549.1 Uncharacterised protein [Mycoplasma putrefaciens]
MDKVVVFIITSSVVGLILLIIGIILQIVIKKKNEKDLNLSKTTKRITFLSLLSTSLIVAGILVLIIGGLNTFLSR